MMSTVFPAHGQGTTPSQVQLQSTLTSDSLTFAIHVQPAASATTPLTAPTGTVTLYDGTTPINADLALTADPAIAAATFQQVFGKPDPSLGTVPAGGVWGDFNDDGHPDLLVYAKGQGGLVVQLFARNGLPAPLLVPPPYFASFTALSPQQLALPNSINVGNNLSNTTMAVLDVDGDGHLDLLAGNTVAYGKGDGTFGRVGVLPALATGYNQTYAVDIDGDGKLDIVAVNAPPTPTPTFTGTVQYAFTVFHNGGSGNFTAKGAVSAGEPNHS